MQFRCYELAVQFYKTARTKTLPRYLKNQLERAASSVALNLSEGSGRATKPDRRHFFQMAFGSVRECQAITALEDRAFSQGDRDLLDHLAASTWKLLHPK